MGATSSWSEERAISEEKGAEGRGNGPRSGGRLPAGPAARLVGYLHEPLGTLLALCLSFFSHPLASLLCLQKER